MSFFITVLVVFSLLMVNEAWWRKHRAHGELSRKFVHITVGSFVAFWPYFLSWGQIELLSVAFLIVISISKYLGIFKAIHSVQRPTYGEVFFALAVGSIALITHDAHIYTVALLQMSLADGLAAIIGTRFGARYKYQVLGHAKSLVGTLTFFAVSIGILVGYNAFEAVNLMPGTILGLSMITSIIENFGIGGLDNLLVPVLVASVLCFIR